MSEVGGGVPDLLVGFRGANILMEIKDPKKFSWKNHNLTEDQIKFHQEWTGQAAIVTTVEEAIALLFLD